MLLRPEELTDDEQQTVELLCRFSPEVRQAQQLALSFAGWQRSSPSPTG
jgi:hypothetical protein